MRIYLSLLFVCFSYILVAQNHLSALLNDTTGLKWREASVSWYIGSHKFLYRKRIQASDQTSTWKRYNLSMSGSGFISKTRNFTILNGPPSSVFSFGTAVGFGREKRRSVSKALSNFKWYYGYEIAPGFETRRVRSSLASLTGGAVVIYTTDLDFYTLGMTFSPVAGLRYDFNARFSLALETGASASVGVEYIRAKDETTFVGGTIVTEGYGLEYNVFTTPIRAVWLTYTF